MPLKYYRNFGAHNRSVSARQWFSPYRRHSQHRPSVQQSEMYCQPLIAGKNENIENIILDNCEFEYQKGNTHPYYIEKLDHQPNIPEITEAPFKIRDKLYIKQNGSKNVTIK